MPIKKWEARVVGAVLIAGLTVALSLVSETPKAVILFGLLAGAIAGGAIWEEMKDR